VHLDFERVRSRRGRSERHGLHVAGVAGGVAGICHHGQMREFVQRGHGVKVEGVARPCLERANSAFAKHDIVIALAHDVLGRHEQFVNSAGNTAFKQDGRSGSTYFLEQAEVLRVAGADLHDVDTAIDEQLDVAHVHDLGHDGHARFRLGLEQKIESALSHALVRVRGGTGLIRAAAEHGGTGGLATAGDTNEVRPFDGARTGDDLEVASADHDATAVHDRVGRVKFAVCFFEGFRHALNALDDVHGLEQKRVDLGGVAHEPDDGLVLAAAYVRRETLALDPGDDTGYGVFRGVFAQDCNHVLVLSVSSSRRCRQSIWKFTFECT
jgi:hypothetical protein